MDKKNNRIQCKLNKNQIDINQEEFIIECQKDKNLSIGKNPIISYMTGEFNRLGLTWTNASFFKNLTAEEKKRLKQMEDARS